MYAVSLLRRGGRRRQTGVSLLVLIYSMMAAQTYSQEHADNMDDQVKSTLRVKNVENKLLHNFTIPKIKRVAEKGSFVRCLSNQRELSDILGTLDKGRLNMGFELKSSWNFYKMQLVLNDEFEHNFSEKRAEMKENGRHGRELEEKFCFLVVTHQVSIDIAKNGLTAGNMTSKMLGDPEMGVYLFRHIDVALNLAHRRNMDPVVIVIFKVLFGKVKKVNTSSAIKATLDPTPNFDSHVSKKSPSWNDPFDDLVTNSLIYLYEYDSNFKPVKTPRHFFPTALVHATFIVQKTVSSAVPVRSTKSISSENSTFTSCTVAQRFGKGKHATIIFKSVRSTVTRPDKEVSQNNDSGKEATALPVTALDQTSDMLSAPTFYQNHVIVPDSSPSIQTKNILENLMSSCMVITSKSMKDPRLLKRNEPEALVPDQCLPSPQKPNCPVDNLITEKEQEEPSIASFLSCDTIQNSSLYLSFEERRFNETIPKEQLKKYTSFLSLKQSERESKIQSLSNISAEEKAIFFGKKSTYDKYEKMHDNPLEIEKETQPSKMVLTKLAVSTYVSECATTGSDKNNVFPSSPDSRQSDKSSVCMPQNTNQGNKSPTRTSNPYIENNNGGSSCLKSHVVDESNVGTTKAKVLQNGQSSLTHGNCKRGTSSSENNRTQKVGTYKVHPKDLKSQLKVDVNVSPEITAVNSGKSPSKSQEPPLPCQKVDLQKTVEKSKLRNLLEDKIQKPKVKGDFKKDHSTSTKQILVAHKQHDSKIEASITKGLDTKTAFQHDHFISHSSDNKDKGGNIKEILNTDPIQSLPLERGICNTYNNAVKTQHFEKFNGQKSMTAKNTDVNGCVLTDHLRYVIELENRIDWKGIFGMEMEKANALMEDAQTPSLRREKEPCGMRIFPDMEITVINTHYAWRNDPPNNLIGEMHPSRCVKDDGDVLFNSSKTSTPSSQTEHGSNLPDCKTSTEHNLKPRSPSVQVAGVILSDDKGSQGGTTLDDTSVKCIQKLNRTISKRPNKKRIPSVLIKRSATRLNKFSQSEENIKVVLGMLSDEIPLCKNKRISKKLSRAILHLRKAHKRVQKSLQIVAKGRERQNVHKTATMQDNIKNDNVPNLKQSREATQNSANECETASSHKMSTIDSLTQVTSDILKQKSSSDRKCLTESTDAINGVSLQESQLTKSLGSSPPTSPSAFKSNVCSPETSEDHNNVTSLATANKENAAPEMTPTENKGVHVENTEAVTKDGKLHDSVNLKRHSVCTKRVLSQVRKHSFHTKTQSKCSKNKSQASKEQCQRKAKRTKESVCNTKKTATTPCLLLKFSNILQKASRTHSLKSLHDCKLFCKNMLPVFTKAFEKKQQCVLKDVVVDRTLFFEQNLKTCFKCALKPQAVEPFLELQMVIETDQYIENRIRYIEGKPTFRSFLWYDRSLYSELLMGESGFQQQSHFYTAFQKKLEQDALTTLKNHYSQLSEYLQAMHRQNSYYVYLKYKREHKECEEILKHDCDHSSFSLSVPFSCGVNLGDTIDDLASLQKSTLEIISGFINLPQCDSGKKEHALCLLEIISAKINFIKTAMTISIQVSLFGIEHLLFDAAKLMFYRERRKHGGQKKTTPTKEFMAQTNHFALSKLYEVYCFSTDKMNDDGKQDDSLNGILLSQRSLDVNPAQDGFLVGKVIDQARYAKPNVLKQMILDCKERLQHQKKCFQILQECDVDQVLIKESNVIKISQRQDLLPTLLKGEAVESYIELVMIYETLHFLDCLIASHRSQETRRGLLWYDSSLLSDLVHNQEKLVSLLRGDLMLDCINIIDCTISEIKSELEVICDCTNSINYSYAFQIMTRELSELSELKDFVLKSKPSLCTYLHFSPYIVSIHYGCTSAELDHNYNQLSDFLAILMSAPKQDLGKMAHTLKIMKTIEFAKALVFNSDISVLDLITCHILQNKMKHEQDLKKRQKEDRPKVLNGQSSRKRLCSQTSRESGASFKPKKQKVLKSYKESSDQKREVNQMKSNLRAKTPPREKLSCIKKSVKDPPQKDSKSLYFSSAKVKKQDHVIERAAAAGIHRSEKEAKPNSSKQQCHDKAEKFIPPSADTSLEAAVSTDVFSNEHTQIERTCIDSLCTESAISTRADDETVSHYSDTIQMEDKTSIIQGTPHLSESDNVTSVNKCSSNTTVSEELKNSEQEITVEEGRPETNPTGIALQDLKPNNWNNQPILPMSNPFVHYPGSVNPWNYSLYFWYQNGGNTGVMSQGYQGSSYNTQQTNPYIQPSAFPALQNSYASNQSYGNFTSQLQTQMYPNSGPFATIMPHNYNDGSSKQNSVPTSYSYSSTSNSGWPWNSWQ